MITTIVKVTKAQMDLLESGGSIGTHTYDPEHCLYTVDDGLVLPDDNGTYGISTSDNGETYQYVDLRTVTNKFCYNLGAYDSIVDNGDGTVTIIRQTGYIHLDGSENWNQWYQEKKYFLLISDFIDQPSAGNKPPFAVCNIGYTYRNIWDGDLSFDLCANPNSGSWTEPAIDFRNDSISSTADWKSYVANHPITIEYCILSESGLVHTETVIKDCPISQLDASGEKWVKNEYKKTINLMPQSEITVVADNATYANKATQAVFVEVGKTYTVSFVAQVTNANMCPYVAVYCNGTHFNKTGEYNTNKQTLSFTFTATDPKFYLLVYATTGTQLTNTTTLSNIILAEGFALIPYVPYDASGHITDKPATLLLNEYEKTVNHINPSDVVPSLVGVDILDTGIYMSNATYEWATAIYNRAIPTGVTRTISFNAHIESPGSPWINFYDGSDHNYAITEGFNTFTRTGPCNIVFYISRGTIGGTLTLTSLMLNDGPTAQPYRPYDASGHITHSEAKLLLDEYEKTVNLFNTAVYKGDYFGNNARTIWQADGTAILRATSSNDPYAWGTDVIMLPAGTYTLSFKRSIAGSAAYIYIPKSEQSHYTPLGTAAGIMVASFTVDGSTQMRIRFGGDDNGSNQDTVYSDFMLTKGDEYIPYIPYHGPIVHEGDAGVLLWQSAGPSSTFAAQTVTISASSAYQYLVIGVKNYKNWTSYNFIKIKNTVGGNAMLYSIETDGSRSIGTKSRKVTIVSDTSITFSAGWDTNSNVQNNDVCTPVVIYGTNIL